MSFHFTDNSGAFIDAMNEKVKQALWTVGATAETHAKEGCPVDTGRLRNSITHQEDEQATYIGTNVEYAPFVEFGSIHNPNASHFLLNAAQNHKDEYKQMIDNILKN